MALISVLWGIALMSIIAASFLSTGNVSYRLAHNATEIARADALVDAAVNRAVLALVDPRPDHRWRVDGTARSIDLGGAAVRISIQDELGRIDLNHAEGALLIGLLRSAGLETQAASDLTDKMLDWRDANPGKRLNGAKEQDYRIAGLSQRPRSGSFQSVDELKLVMGMTAELYARIAPALTVYSGRPLIDPQVAPPQALLALPTMDAAKVAALISARAESASAPSGGQGGSPPLTSLQLIGRAFTVHVEFRKPGLVREPEEDMSASDVVIRLVDDPVRPYWILSRKPADPAAPMGPARDPIVK
jgi:general secretion pathway protein K